MSTTPDEPQAEPQPQADPQPQPESPSPTEPGTQADTQPPAPAGSEPVDGREVPAQHTPQTPESLATQETTPLPDAHAPAASVSSQYPGQVHASTPVQHEAFAQPEASAQVFGAAEPASPAQQHFSAASQPQHASAPHAYSGAPAFSDPRYPQSVAFESGSQTAPAQQPQTSHSQQQQPRRQAGLVAGIAIGALIGGLVGGGAAAVVAHNSSGSTTVQAQPSAGGSLTLDNLDSATAITGVAAVATPSVVTLQVSSGSGAGTGSGVIYSADGYIITNAHVATLEGATSNPEIQVQLSDGTLLPGTLVGSDPFADIAVVKVDATDLPPIAVADSDKINVGDLAVAIGAPLSLSNTVTSGVVSALNRGISVSSSMVPDEQEQQSQDGEQYQEESPFPWFQFEGPNGEQQQPQQKQQSSAGTRVAIPVIQTDASINPGNSGGALLNANGELIGINVALASASSSSEAAGSDGLGFAVPANFAVRVADALIAGERPSHGLLGVVQTSDSGNSTAAGGVIGEVTSGSPADDAGLRAGDVITSVNGVRADSFTTVTALVRMYAAGTEITIGYNRDGQQLETQVTLGELDW